MRVAAWLCGALWPALAAAQGAGCTIAPFQGATTSQGALAQVQMRNRGITCAIGNYGVPAEKSNPADAGRILEPPRHGKASFDAPNANYLPAPGFVGEDEFRYEAWAQGASGQPLRLLVTVKVTVKPAK